MISFLLRNPHGFIRFSGASLTLLALAACSGLPKGGGRTASTALKDTNHTKLGTTVRSKVAAHPGQSGLHLLSDPHDAFTARLALADAAQRSLDVQYFIWNNDMTGKVLAERLFRAADRGVRVRLLLDDLGTMPSDKVLLAIDSHPNIEVRMFNPVAWRTLRLLGALADFGRINRRMHNKSFTADGQVAIVGGRNVGDEYYGAHEGANFADLDVAVIGPVVKEVSEDFDLYWNHVAAVPIANLSRQNTTPKQYAAMRANLGVHHEGDASDYLENLRQNEFAQDLRKHAVSYFWARAKIVEDHPDKVRTPSSDRDTHLAPQLLELIHHTKLELFLVSPYFVPGKAGVEILAEARRRGVRVVVLTNSLASTDGIAVNAGYSHYRKSLIEAGIELYELKPTATSKNKRKSGGGMFGSRGAGGSSGASLHAKTFAFDRQTGFIGSYNIDPRSSRLNTEMGVVFDCPELARQVPESVERDLAHNTYRVTLENNRIVWVALEKGQKTRYLSEPHAGLGKRIKSKILSWLPIESLL